MKDAIDSGYHALNNVLEEEIKIYRSLLDIVRREKDLLIAAQIDELSENNKVKETAILKLKGLERIREKAARDMALAVGTNSDQPRLLDIAFKLPEPQNSKLRSIHSTLELLIKRIREINAGNEELVSTSLKTVNGALGAIKNTLQPRITYAQSGEKKSVDLAGCFVSREA